jgi:carbonic anhydrase
MTDLEDLPPAAPRRHLAVLACMDARFFPSRLLELDTGEAHILRNAGGLATDDAIRSLAISQRKLGTREIVVIQHTGCGMCGFDDVAFRDELEAETGERPSWDVPGFAAVEESVRDTVATLRATPLLPHRDAIRGYVLDIDSGQLTEVS